jgi:hypothetical protein
MIRATEVGMSLVSCPVPGTIPDTVSND